MSEYPQASYNRARYYDPSPGRFVSEDPTGFSGGPNFYQYVGNHPTDFIDPSGLLQVCCRSAHLVGMGSYARKTLQPTPCHCFLKLADGSTLGGYHAGLPLLSGSLGSLVIRKNDDSDHHKYAQEATYSSIPGASCQTDGAAQRGFNALGGDGAKLGGYGFAPSRDAGTSNDAAMMILREAGINYQLPLCAWGKNTNWYPFIPFVSVHFPVPLVPF